MRILPISEPAYSSTTPGSNELKRMGARQLSAWLTCGILAGRRIEQWLGIDDSYIHERDVYVEGKRKDLLVDSLLINEAVRIALLL